jgi:ParB family chromosome partitioning protein
MAFPPLAYTDRGGVGSVTSALQVARELAVPAAPEPEDEDEQPLAA